MQQLAWLFWRVKLTLLQPTIGRVCCQHPTGILLFISLTCPLAFTQGLCKVWGEATRLTNLPTVINESSGISASQQFDRLYHTNDSWNSGPEFFITDSQGENLERIPIVVSPNLIRTIDIEDMDTGPCVEGSCIFLADIGDNLSKRPNVHVLIIPENLNEIIKPRVLTLNYPDTPHDAEAFAIHPNGDLYILTKEVYLLRTPPAKLYRLPYGLWQEQHEVYTLEFVTEIDIRALSGSTVNILSHIATGMDISSDGKRFIILTYGEVFELELDLSALNTNTKLPDLPYNGIEVTTLLQQESITYTAQGHGFLYSAESKGQPSPLIKMMCKD